MLTSTYQTFTWERRSFAEIASDAKLEQAQTAFAPELAKLRSLYDHPGLEQATASLPVYRSYIQPRSGHVDDADRGVLAALPNDLREVLLLNEPGHDEFVVRFQQTTGPVMAKGIEDTAFYRYLRLTALNEVGGDPGRFSLPVAGFHQANLARAERFPQHMLASQTHDTKRSGDVRARLGAISEFADEWTRLVGEWHQVNDALRAGPGPDANEEYLIYQTLLGAWPIEPKRLHGYLEKALREAKINTNWDEPDEIWEQSVHDFADRLYDHGPFRSSFDAFLRKVIPAGEDAALGALLLRLTSPGFADIYQGDELWELSLVDPDNRRPVDWAQRTEALTQLRDRSPPNRALRKLHLIRETLALRARCPGSFTGPYIPLPADPAICAFQRGHDVAVIVSVRQSADVSRVELPAGDWTDLLPNPATFAPVRLLERQAKSYMPLRP